MSAKEVTFVPWLPLFWAGAGTGGCDCGLPGYPPAVCAGDGCVVTMTMELHVLVHL